MIPNWLDSMVIITHILSLDLDWYPTFFKQEDKFDSQNQVRQADIIIENIWGYKIIFNHGRSDSTRVCMLLKPSATFDVLNTVRDDKGRILLVTLKVNKTMITLANIYGQNNDDGSFFSDLYNLLSEHGQEPYIIGGDFNTVVEAK